MATPDVRVRLSAEGTAEVIAALRKVQAEAQAAGRKSSRSFTEFSSVLGSARGLLAQLGVALSVGAFIGFIRNAARAGEEIGNLSQRTGRATDSMLALSLVAQETNTDVELLAKSVVFLQKNVKELEESRGDAPQLFKAIGVSLRELRGKDAAQQLDLVVQKLGDLKDSGEKALLTTGLLGKGTDKLIPLFNRLASGGMAEVAERMKELGVDAAVIQSVGELDQALDDLNRDAQLIGLTFAGEMAPDIQRAVRAIASALEGEGVESIKAFARFFGFAMKLVTGVALLAAESIRGAFMLIWGPIETAALVGTRIIQARYAEALEAAKDGAKKFGNELRTQITFSRQIQIARDLLSPAEAPKGDRGGQGAESDPSETAEAFKRREQLLASALDNELKLIQARLKFEGEGQRRAFEQGLTGVRQYYRQRRVVVERETAAEMRVLVQRLVLERTNPDADARGKNLADIESKLAVLRVQEAAQKAEIAAEELKTVRELGDRRLEFLRRQMDFEGQRHASAMLDLQAEAEALDQVLRKQGVPDTDRTRQVGAFLAAGQARLQFDELDRQVQQSLNDLAEERGRIEEDIAEGRISEIEGEQKIIELQAVRLEQARAIARAQLVAAQATGDEVAIRAAEQTLAGIDSLASSTDQLALKTKNLGQEIARAGLSSFADALANIGTAGNPVLAFMESFIGAVKRLAAEILALELFRALGLSKFLGAGFSGGGKVTKKATGGFVSGPGTGTSDSIPARLSAGEYVVRAAAVRQPGVLPHLEAINRMPSFTRDDILQAQQGMRDVRLRSLASFSRSQRSHFAEGGLVGAGRGGERATRLDGTITLVLPEGATATVDASEETRRILRIVQKNPRAFRHAQGL